MQRAYDEFTAAAVDAVCVEVAVIVVSFQTGYDRFSFDILHVQSYGFALVVRIHSVDKLDAAHGIFGFAPGMRVNAADISRAAACIIAAVAVTDADGAVFADDEQFVCARRRIEADHNFQPFVYASFSMSGIEFADSMDSFFEGTVVVPSADYTQSEAKIEGLAAEYTYGDDVAFTVSALQGYRIVSVTVNGAALTAETDGTYKYSGQCGLELNVVVVTAEASVTAGTVTGSIDCAFDLEGVAITLVGESEISGTVGADNAISMQDVPLGEYTAYITLFGARVSAGTVSVTAAENTAELSYNGQLNGAAYDIASGTVSYVGNGTEGGTDVFAFDGLTFTEKTYIKGVWKLSAETADVAGVGAGIYLRNSAGAIVFRYYYDARYNNQFFQVTDWSYWGGSPDGTAKPGTDIHTCLTGDGLNVAIEFDPQAGSYVLYVDTGSGWQSIAQATIGGKAGCTFTGIAVTAWNNVDFTISDLEITSALE